MHRRTTLERRAARLGRPAWRGVSAALLAACFSLVAAAPAAAEFSEHFPYAGKEHVQHFRVPPGVFWLTIDAEGAPGESGHDIAPAGHGGQITATVPVEPEQLLDIYVGQYGF